jgi:hypothetical protein
VQNFGEEICWKNIIWKTGKKWKDNIMREMSCEDSRWTERTDEMQWRDLMLEELNFSAPLAIIIIIINIIIITIKIAVSINLLKPSGNFTYDQV